MNDERLEKASIASAILDRARNNIRRYVVAVGGATSDYEGEVEGTGIIIELGGEVLLVTAEHVISQIERKGYKHVTFSNGDKKPYAKVLVPFIKDASIDIAYVQIPRPEQPYSDRLACPERLFAQTAYEVDRDLLFIYGFPGRDSKFWTLSKGIRSKTLTFAAYAGVAKNCHFNPETHFALEYRPRDCVGVDGQSAELAIPPGGLSGTAVWNIPRDESAGAWKPDNAHFVGIVQEWDQNGQFLIARRIEHILPFLLGDG